MSDFHIPRVQITRNDDGTHQLLVDGRDLSMLAQRVDLSIDSTADQRLAMVNVWIPASAAVDIPADLTIFVDDSSSAVVTETEAVEPAQAFIEQIERERFETQAGYLNNFEPWLMLKQLARQAAR